MHEILRPENFGFEASRRNLELFLAFQTRSNALVYGDDGSSDFDRILENFRKSDPSICICDLGKMNTERQIQVSIGMKRDKYGWNPVSIEKEDKYLVFRKFDRFVLNHTEGLEYGGNTSRIYDLIRLAQKYSSGSMFTVHGESGRGGVYDKILEVAGKSQALKDLLDDHAVIYIIP